MHAYRTANTVKGRIMVAKTSGEKEYAWFAGCEPTFFQKLSGTTKHGERTRPGWAEGFIDHGEPASQAKFSLNASSSQFA